MGGEDRETYGHIRSERETEQPCELGNRESSRVWTAEFGWKYRKEVYQEQLPPQ